MVQVLWYERLQRREKEDYEPDVGPQTPVN